MSKALQVITTVVITLGFAVSAAGQGGGPGPLRVPGHAGHELDRNLVLPQIVVGRHYTMNLLLLNLGDSERMGWTAPQNLETAGTIYFFKQDGTPFSLRVNGATPDTKVRFSVKPSEILYLELSSNDPSNDPDTPGWALIDVDQTATQQFNWGMMDGQSVMGGERLSVTAFFSLKEGDQLRSRVGVVPSIYERARFFTSVLAAQFQDDINTGVAIVNTGATDSSIEIRLKGLGGETLSTRTLLLARGHQTALFVDELFAGRLPDPFRGSLEIVTQAEGVVTMGLLMTQGILTSIPMHHHGLWSMGFGGMGMMR